MAITTLDDFEPLDREQIKKAVSGNNIPTLQELTETSSQSFNNQSLRGKSHFTLDLDRGAPEKQSSICVENCDYFIIRSCHNVITLTRDEKFFLAIKNCTHFVIEGLSAVSGGNVLFIDTSSSFKIRNCRVSDAEGSGIIISDGHSFRISDCSFDNILSAGILIIGHSYKGEVRNCSVSGSRGFFNHDAGINLCHTSPEITPDKIPEQIHEPLSITEKTKRPHNIYIKSCILNNCRAQGIYLEGAVNCLIENNILLNNNKEGVCFDWGSSYHIFCRNTVALNGERRMVSPAEIEADYIAQYPLLDDKSSSMKLPGISLDNGCMNLICENTINGNYGGGIKMIRTALFNEIVGNKLYYNALGANEYVPHFHGVTVLGLGAKKKEFVDENRQELLDFMPSVLNSISHNTILESILGIFLDKFSSNNNVTDNIILVQNPKHKPLISTYIRTRACLKRCIANLMQKAN